MLDTNRTRRVAIGTGMAVAVLVALLLPLSYFGISYRYIAGAIETEAEITAGIVSGIISTNPVMWRYERVRLEELLSRRLRAGHAQQARILDTERRPVAESVTPLSPPLITRHHELLDAGTPVGSIEISHSLRPLLEQTFLVALLGLAIGGTLFALLWQIPFRGMILAERRRQEFIDTLMENSANSVLVLDPSGVITMANASSTVISGLRPNELIGRTFTQLFKSGDESSINRRLDEVTTGSTAMAKFKAVLVRGDGKEVSVFCGAVPLLQENRVMNLLVSMDDVSERMKARQDLRRYADELSRQINERKRAEEQLAREKDLLSVTLAGIADGVVSTDCAGSILLMNRMAEELTGWLEAEAVGRRLEDVVRVRDTGSGAFLNDLVAAAITASHGLELTRNSTLVDRAERAVAIDLNATTITDSAGSVIGTVFVFRDITVRLALEEEYLQRQKLESIGVLAGGIAHDFNNLLTAILGNISLAKRYSGDVKRCTERLNAAEKASLRAGDLTKHFLTFTKGGKPIRAFSLLSDVVRDSTDFGLTGSNIRCEFALQSDLWPVEIDESQISEVIHNLVINARQAMPGGGLLRVGGSNITMEERQALPLKPGKYVMLTVADQGSGIPGELLPRIFDPYFTTKKKGNGLGLAVAYSVLQNHDGHIAVESVPNEGTTFRLYLPASERETAERAVREEQLRNGHGTILLMDDEDMVLETGSEMLRLLGYQVELAMDGAEMLEKYRAAMVQGTRIDAVVLDLTIPGGMGGEEAVARLLELDPQARAIVSSGFSNNPVMADYQAYGFCGMVAKPYAITSLERAISRALGE